LVDWTTITSHAKDGSQKRWKGERGGAKRREEGEMLEELAGRKRERGGE